MLGPLAIVAASMIAYLGQRQAHQLARRLDGDFSHVSLEDLRAEVVDLRAERERLWVALADCQRICEELRRYMQ